MLIWLNINQLYNVHKKHFGKSVKLFYILWMELVVKNSDRYIIDITEM